MISESVAILVQAFVHGHLAQKFESKRQVVHAMYLSIDHQTWHLASADPVSTQWNVALQMPQHQWHTFQNVQAAQWSGALAFTMDDTLASYGDPPNITTTCENEAAIEGPIEYYHRSFERTGIAVEQIEAFCENLDMDFLLPSFQKVVDFLQMTVDTRGAAAAYAQLWHIANTGVVSHEAVQPLKAVYIYIEMSYIA